MHRWEIGIVAIVALLVIIFLIHYLIKINQPESQKILDRRDDLTKYFHQRSAPWLVTVVIIICSIVILNMMFQYLIPIDFFPLRYKTADENVTTATKMFATLITIILALIALLVTIYVFLVGSLAGRKEYERENVAGYRRLVTRQLFVGVLISCLCIIGCLLADNLGPDIVKLVGRDRLDFIFYGIMLASFLDVIYLIYLTIRIVGYEKSLVVNARTYIDHNIHKVGEHGICSHNNGRRTKSNPVEGYESIKPFAEHIIKDVGDLEIIISNLVKNHEADFRYGSIPAQDRLYRTIVLKKWKDNREEWEETEANNFCDDYARLIEIRNRLWIVQRSYKEFSTKEDRIQKNDENRNITEYNQSSLKKRIDVMLSEAVQNLMSGERFKDQNFINVRFSSAQLKNASFQDSAFIGTVFCGASLDDADFTDALMQNITMKNTCCDGTVFRRARISDLSIEVAGFHQAVFDEAEITFGGGNNLLPELPAGKTHNFREISGRELNLIGASLNDADFSYSSLNHILINGGRINECVFDYCNLENAVFTNTQVISCKFNFADMEELSAAFSIWGGKKEPDKPIEETGKTIVLREARLPRANFTNSYIHICDFQGAYINDAFFGEADLEKCLFNDAFLDHTDFTNVKMRGVHFKNASMNGVLITSFDNTKVNGEDIEFTDAKMVNSEIRNRYFKRCNFDRALLSNTIIRHVTFEECSFKDCQFDGTLLMDVHWNNNENLAASKWVSGGQIEFGTQGDRERFEKGNE